MRGYKVAIVGATGLVGRPKKIEAQIRKAYDKGVLIQLADRIDGLYVDLASFNHASFWKGVAGFVRKRDCQWMTSYQPIHEHTRSLVRILEHAVQRSEHLRKTAFRVFDVLHKDGEAELTAYWLRHHVFVHGLFGHVKSGGDAWFLTAAQTKALARDMSQGWRKEHLSGKLIPCRWDLQPVYTMIDTGVWDDPCRKVLDEALSDDRAIDGFTLMLFGGPYSTEPSTIAKMCDYEAYKERARARLGSATFGELHETVQVALRKALSELMEPLRIRFHSGGAEPTCRQPVVGCFGLLTVTLCCTSGLEKWP